MSAAALLAAFGDIDKFPAGAEAGVLSRDRLARALRSVLGQLDPIQQQSTFNNVSMLLQKA